MKHVLMYSKPTCPYCQRAIKLLESKGIYFEVINLLQTPEKRQEMIEKSGGKYTVPQIFIDEKHIGGCDDLYQLDEEGILDQLLNINNQ